jgi:hypothetical protein
MDINRPSRRALLQTLAAGGAAVAASTVTTDVAFADGGTLACRAFTSAAFALDLTTIQVLGGPTGSLEYAPRTTATVSNGPTTCPCAPSVAPTAEIKWVLTAPAPPAGTTVFLVRNNVALAQNTYFPLATHNVVSVASLPDDVAPTLDDLEVQGTFTLTATIRYTCPGRGPTNATRCFSRRVTYGWNGPTQAVDNFTSGPTNAPTQNFVAC